MQIFLAFPNVRRSLQVLDNARLGKQRVEAFQVYKILVHERQSRWAGHPTVRMWQGYENLLRQYIIISLEVWGARKTKDGSRYMSNAKMLENVENYGIALKPHEEIKYPEWWGLEKFHNSHKAMLYHKGELKRKKSKLAENFYQQFEEYSSIVEYWWPVPLKGTTRNEPKKSKRAVSVPDESALPPRKTRRRSTLPL